MVRKPSRQDASGQWDAAAGEPEWPDDAPAPHDDAPPAERHLDTVTAVLAALPSGDEGRTLKLALLDALEESTRADRVALPLGVKGLRARVRAGSL
jgi:hypothetical protein